MGAYVIPVIHFMTRCITATETSGGKKYILKALLVSLGSFCSIEKHRLEVYVT